MEIDHVFNAKAARAIALRAQKRYVRSGEMKRVEEWKRKDALRKQREEREAVNVISREEVAMWRSERKEKIEALLEILGVEEGMKGLRRMWEAGLIGGGGKREKFVINYRPSPTAARVRRIIDVGGPEWQPVVVSDERRIEAAESPAAEEEGAFEEPLYFDDEPVSAP